jgi:hypothetical protein
MYGATMERLKNSLKFGAGNDPATIRDSVIVLLEVVQSMAEVIEASRGSLVIDCNRLLASADNEVVLKTGSASIALKKDGSITISGKDIAIQASGKIDAKASGNVVLKGSKILQN